MAAESRAHAAEKRAQDAEHKATKFVLATPGGVFGFTMATSNPHNRAFWTSAFGFFSSFFS